MQSITSTHSALAAAVDDVADDLIAFASELVRTPSLPDGEGPVQELVAERLRGLGLDVDVFTCRHAELEGHPAFNDDGFSGDSRVDVVGVWRGTGGGRSIVLNGHVDVVPAGPLELWSASPWSGEIVDGRLYGRGACDMKAGLAAGIYAVAALRAAGVRLAGDVVVESVIGEESGGLGTLAAIARGYRADAAVILEPTRLRMCPVQSGALTFRLSVPGRATHAAMKPEGVSAVAKFVALFEAIEQLEQDRHARFSHPLYDDPTHVAPVSIGTVRAGEWHSTVPERLVAEGRFGVFPGESAADARAALEAAVETAAQQDEWLRLNPPAVEWFEGQFESGACPLDDPIIDAIGGAHTAVTGAAPAVEGVTYGSDLRLFTNHAGMPAVLYGPGDVRLAHAADEYVPVEEVVTAAKVMAVLLSSWCR
ncbi:MAG TPA: ArgE/DapE family deacylase [Acidimicrobiales bacterium]|nr:ArgE/DapE family deacylase [Acidimicrobiales bacterium]